MRKIIKILDWTHSFDFVYARRTEIHNFKIFGGHLGRHLGKYATVVIVSTYLISVFFISYESTLHSFLYLKAELRYIRFRFSAAILAAILENMQLLFLFSTYLISTFFISYESTLHSFLYLEAELRYIRIRFSAAILAAILENMQLLLFFSTYLISTSFISYELTLHSSLYLKAELKYIRSRISAAILAAILNFFNLFI